MAERQHDFRHFRGTAEASCSLCGISLVIGQGPLSRAMRELRRFRDRHHVCMPDRRRREDRTVRKAA